MRFGHAVDRTRNSPLEESGREIYCKTCHVKYLRTKTLRSRGVMRSRITPRLGVAMGHYGVRFVADRAWADY
jgi:hypothetical protein